MLLKLYFVGNDKFHKLSSFSNYLAQIPFKFNPKKIILDIKRYRNPEIDHLEASNNKVSGKKQFNVFKKKKRDDLLMLSRYDGDLKRSIFQII